MFSSPAGEDVQVISKPLRESAKSLLKWRKRALDAGKMGFGSVLPQNLPSRGAVAAVPFLT